MDVDARLKTLQGAAVDPLKRFSLGGVGVSFQTLEKWLYVCRNMSLDANTQLGEGNLDQAYVLYFRLVSVILECLPKHRDWSSPGAKWVRDWAATNAPLALAKLEEIHTEFLARQAVVQARAAVIAAPPGVVCIDAAVSGPQVTAPGAQLQGPYAALKPFVGSGASSIPPRASPEATADSRSAPLASAPGAAAPAAAAAAVPYASLLDVLHGVAPAGSLDRASAGGAAAPASAPAATPAHPPVSPYAAGGPAAGAAKQLRPLRIPARLIDTFRDLAHANSLHGERGIETCGIVAGRAAGSGELVVTHLIVPKQRGSADNCEMLDEDSLLMYCMEQGLITVGWIHTHPSQPCFLSSVDLHTHFPYQIMLPEAVAIVVAPRDPKLPFAAFRLTDEPSQQGLATIQQCEMKGFHPHADTGGPLFAPASHCIIDQSSPLQVCDMR